MDAAATPVRDVPGKAPAASPWRLCVAPMLDWTDRHCRYFHRQLAPGARLYTEMVTTGALLHGDQARHLDFDAAEHPVALQLGGSDPAELVACARLGERWGYDEINLNCGCPSERVQRGAFGACLMAEPALVADCVRAMQDAVGIPVTVKHRIGLERGDEEAMVMDFVGHLFEAGCRVFIVHARRAWLKGLSPKENREVPPLRYDVALRLRSAFPQATVVLNGGLATVDALREQLQRFDGVMIGRVAYHEPWVLAQAARALLAAEGVPAAPQELLAPMGQYLARQVAAGEDPRVLLRHLLGLFHGRAGARTWRRLLSDPGFTRAAGAASLQAAAEASFGRPLAAA